MAQEQGLHALASTGALERLMGGVAEESNPNRITRLVPAVCASLGSLRDKHGEDWRAFIPAVREMKGYHQFHEDPFTRHAYTKPRGYAGDAGLIDHIYRPYTILLDSISTAGRAIFRYTSAGPAPRAVNNRRALLARKVDGLAASSDRPVRVASLACGHLREAELIASMEGGMIEKYYAVDQDARSLTEVENSFHGSSVVPIRGSVKDLLRGSLRDLKDLDFFYAAGLFDYLEEKVAKRLVKKMFERLAPGGSMWVANFVPNSPDRAYMEAVMDWWLIYRSPEDMALLDAEVPKDSVAAKRVFLEGEGNIAFLELTKQ